jgi:hypothetical protein
MNCGRVTGMELFFDLVNINMRDFRTLSVKDLGQFFEGGAFGLDIEEVDKYEFKKDPDL